MRAMILGVLLLLGGCATVCENLGYVKPTEKPKLNLRTPDPITLKDWVVSYAIDKDGKVSYTITDVDIKVILENEDALVRYIEKQNVLISEYKTFYEK